MKKIFLPIIVLCLLLAIFIPISSRAAIVNCGNSSDGSDSCTLANFFTMLGTIYSFIVNNIAAPLATIAITVGAILIMVSAGNPNTMGNGKKVFWAGVIGLFLALGSKAIINFILSAIGYTGGSV